RPRRWQLRICKRSTCPGRPWRIAGPGGRASDLARRSYRGMVGRRHRSLHHDQRRKRAVTRRRRTHLVLLAVWLACVGGCSSTNQATTPPAAAVGDRHAFGTVALPDLSRASPSVRLQLTEQYASLMAAIEKSAGSTPELAAAYGEMGKLLMA